MASKKMEKSISKANVSLENEDVNKIPGAYVPRGNFTLDFPEMCKIEGSLYIPPIFPRRPRPTSPPPTNGDEKSSIKRGKGDRSSNMDTIESEPVVEEKKEEEQSQFKTFTIAKSDEKFGRCIQVEVEKDSVSEIFIKGWGLTQSLLKALGQCFIKLERLTNLDLKNVGLKDNTMNLLSEYVNECTSLRYLTLDGNPGNEDNFYLFLLEASPVQFLSLKFNEITDRGAGHLAHFLGNKFNQNKKLVSLNLFGNKITDEGALHFSECLRTNRSLLILNLSNNNIGDKGAKEMAKVLSSFELTHEEIVERRKLLSIKTSMEAPMEPPGSRRSARDHRPGSVLSTSTEKETKTKEEEKSSKKKKVPTATLR